MIKDNIIKVRERIVSASSRSGRSPDSVTLVAVTKGRPLEQIREAIESGIVDIAENRVQEAILRVSAVDRKAVILKWHMIGHLQTNKVRKAVGIFDLIQSVDSVRLAQEIDRQAAGLNKVQDILIEIKTSPEPGKSGLTCQQGMETVNEIVKLANIRIKGFMTIAAFVDDNEKRRPYFSELRRFRDKIKELGLTQPDGRKLSEDLNILSMGMSDDFEVAIEEGSTMVRIGRAIFEA